MAGFLYYIPKLTGIAGIGDVREAGLGYAFSDLGGRGEVHGGPDSGNGAIFAAAGRIDDGRVKYLPDKQNWMQVPGTDAWVGMYKTDCPKPSDLTRTRMLDGHQVELGDGNEWLVPVARGAAETDGQPVFYNALPTRVGLNADGSWKQGEVVAAYEPLWGIATKVWDAFTQANVKDEAGGGGRVLLDFVGENDAALAALATNYHVGKAEVVLLGLFTAQCVVDVLKALIDWPTVLQLLGEKKTVNDTQTADTSPTSDGG